MKKVLCIGLMIFIAGCSKPYVTQPEKPLVEEEVVVEEVQVEEKAPAVKYEGEEEVKVAEKERERHVKVALPAEEAAEAPFEFKDALFDFDKYNIRPDARSVLDSIAEWLNKNKSINVLVEGHCVERGTNEYNLALGEKRANAAKNYLAARGVASARMRTVSYGEEKPLCTAHNEDCWQKNRRAHFVIPE